MLSCEGLTKEFQMHIRGGKRITAFRDVSFAVQAGEFLGISGPSGAGKSSLLKCIYRTYRPSAGTLRYTDAQGSRHDLAGADEHTLMRLRKLEIGSISQFFHVIPRISALETITNAAAARGFDRGESKERAQELLLRLGIPPSLWDMFPSTFSGGEKQRINIIHAVIAAPRLLLLDEPTASLDPASAREALALIRELKREGTAMIGVFHDHRVLSELSDSLLELNTIPLGGDA